MELKKSVDLLHGAINSMSAKLNGIHASAQVQPPPPPRVKASAPTKIQKSLPVPEIMLQENNSGNENFHSVCFRDI